MTYQFTKHAFAIGALEKLAEQRIGVEAFLSHAVATRDSELCKIAHSIVAYDIARSVQHHHEKTAAYGPSVYAGFVYKLAQGEASAEDLYDYFARQDADNRAFTAAPRNVEALDKVRPVPTPRSEPARILSYPAPAAVTAPGDVFLGQAPQANSRAPLPAVTTPGDMFLGEGSVRSSDIASTPFLSDSAYTKGAPDFTVAPLQGATQVAYPLPNYDHLDDVPDGRTRMKAPDVAPKGFGRHLNRRNALIAGGVGTALTAAGLGANHVLSEGRVSTASYRPVRFPWE